MALCRAYMDPVLMSQATSSTPAGHPPRLTLVEHIQNGMAMAHLALFRPPLCWRRALHTRPVCCHIHILKATRTDLRAPRGQATSSHLKSPASMRTTATEQATPAPLLSRADGTVNLEICTWAKDCNNICLLSAPPSLASAPLGQTQSWAFNQARSGRSRSGATLLRSARWTQRACITGAGHLIEEATLSTVYPQPALAIDGRPFPVPGRPTFRQIPTFPHQCRGRSVILGPARHRDPRTATGRLLS